MNRDCRIYRRSTLLQMKEGDPDWEAVIDGLEVVSGGGKDERFQIITSGLQIPACSFVSRTDDDNWYIDTGVDYDGGRMYIGQRDFDGMASAAGYIAKSSVSRVYEENVRLRNELAIAKSLVGDLRAAVAGLVGATPMETSSRAKVAQRTVEDQLDALGEHTDTSDLDLNAL